MARLFAIRFARGLGAANVATLLAGAAVGVGPSTSPAIAGDDNSGSPSPSTQVGYGNLCNLVAAVYASYLASPKAYWAMSLKTIVSLWALRSKQGNPMIPVQFNGKGEPMLLGIPVAICPNMPAIGPGKPQIERRLAGSVSDLSAGTVTGIAVTYNHLSSDLGGWRERIQRGAFTSTLKSGKDIACLYAHDTGKPLGRTGSGTLEVLRGFDRLALEV